MSDWAPLIDAGLTIRPLSTWPGGVRTGGLRWTRFRVGLPATLGLLARELGHLRAVQAAREDGG